MNCDNAREFLALSAGGDLRGPETAGVDLHLQECPGCRQFYEHLESNQALLRSLRTETATPAALTRMRGELFARLENPADVLGWRIRLERFLLTGFRRPRYAVAGVAIAAILSITLFAQMRRVAAGPVVMATVFEGENTLLPPDYRDWKVVDVTAHEDHHSFGKAYISPGAFRDFTQTGKFPEGTVMILESARASASFLASVKDSSRFEGGWGYFEFSGSEGRQASKTAALPKSAGCVACHRDRAAMDHVFTQFYPVLRTAAGML